MLKFLMLVSLSIAIITISKKLKFKDSPNDKNTIGAYVICFALFITTYTLSFINYTTTLKNELINYESNITYIDFQLANIHSKNYKVIKSLLSNYKMSQADLENITKIYVDGRKVGNSALFVILNEKVPNINKELVAQLNATMISNYSEFYKLQNSKIEIIRDYEKYLQCNIFRPMFIKVLNYPKIDLKESKSIILMEETRNVMESGNDGIEVE